MIFQELPSKGSGTRTGQLEDVVDQLKQFPGLWSKIGNVGYRGGFKAFTNRGVKIARRLQPDGTWDVYASWPEDKEQE